MLDSLVVDPVFERLRAEALASIDKAVAFEQRRQAEAKRVATSDRWRKPKTKVVQKAMTPEGFVGDDLPEWLFNLDARSRLDEKSFLDTSGRRYPWRDLEGKISLPLLQRAIERAGVAGEARVVELARAIVARIDSNSTARRLHGLREKHAAQQVEFALKSQPVSPSQKRGRRELAAKWDRLVNMSGKDVLTYASGHYGKKSGLSSGEARSQGVTSGRQRPAQIARLKSKSKASWSDEDWAIAGRVVSFISRMKGADGPLFDEHGRPTRKLMSLWIWGHDPTGGRWRSAMKKKEIMKSVEMSVAAFEIEKGLAPIESAYQQLGDEVANHIKKLGRRLDLSPYSRVIRIVPSIEKVDLQNQAIALDALRKSWDFFEQYGAITIEHIGNPARNDEQAKAYAKKLGYSWNDKAGRTFYEVGRPIPGSFDEESTAFLAYIYAPNENLKTTKGDDYDEALSLANWLWGTLRAVPPAPWKASVGGMASPPAPALVNNKDKLRGVDHRMLIGVIKSYNWFDCTLTRTPVNHHVPPIDILKDGDRDPATIQQPVRPN